jgi:hypothetical protein
LICRGLTLIGILRNKTDCGDKPRGSPDRGGQPRGSLIEDTQRGESTDDYQLVEWSRDAYFLGCMSVSGGAPVFHAGTP